MDISADSERWQEAIQREYDARAQRFPHAALGWRLLYSPCRVLDGARVAFIGFNPGGRFVDPTHGVFSAESGSAYRKDVENWGVSSALQDQVMALFEKLQVSPEDVLAGNLVPFRSPDEASLPDAPLAIAFGRNLWSEIFHKVKPKIVVTMGTTANREISRLLRVRNTATRLVGWGNYSASRGEFSAGTWIGLPHLSRFTIMKRSESQAPLNELLSDLD